MATVLESYGDVVREVLNFGFNDGPQVNVERIRKWVNEAQRQIVREVEAPEFQTTEVLTLTRGTYKYSLPERFLRMQDIFYPELVGRLRPVDLQAFDSSSPALFEGPPEIYTLYGNELWLFPTPNNSTDTLELRFIQNPPTLVGESDVPALNGNYLHLLVDYALVRAFKAEDDEEAAQAHQAQYKADLAAFASDVQGRLVDRPKVVDGTWGGSGGYYGRLV